MPPGTEIPDLARELGCAPATLYGRVLDYEGGRPILSSLPDARNVGRIGGQVGAVALRRRDAVLAAVRRRGGPPGRGRRRFWPEVAEECGVTPERAQGIWAKWGKQ